MTFCVMRPGHVFLFLLAVFLLFVSDWMCSRESGYSSDVTIPTARDDSAIALMINFLRFKCIQVMSVFVM